MTIDFFTAQMDRLRGLRFPPSNLTTHWEGLQDLPEAVLEAAVTRAIKVRIDFPVPQELLEDADVVAHLVRNPAPEASRSEPLAAPQTVTIPQTGTVVPITREWKYYDKRCSDTGWASWWCGPADDVRRKPWSELSRCERSGEHGPHEWVGRCACFASNPALIRRREREQRYAENRNKKPFEKRGRVRVSAGERA